MHSTNCSPDVRRGGQYILKPSHLVARLLGAQLMVALVTLSAEFAEFDSTIQRTI